MNRLELVDQIVEDLYSDKIELQEFVKNSLEQADRIANLEKRNTNAEMLEEMRNNNLAEDFEERYYQQLEESQATYDYFKKKIASLESRNDGLEYASQYNAKLNEFLQKRNLPPKEVLGNHVVKVAMDYIERLEADSKDAKLEINMVESKNRRYKEVIQDAFFATTYPNQDYAIQKAHEILDDALKGELR